MSQYINNNTLFTEPTTKQYGSHMVMTNVMLPTKTKYLNIDTRYSDDYETVKNANYNITLPERINEVKSMKARCAEIPMSFFNISFQLDNNVFNVTDGTTVATYSIPDGFYDNDSLVDAINGIIQTAPSPITDLVFSIVNRRSVFTNTGIVPLDIQFDVSPQGATDLQNMTYKLGWILGFRETDYTIGPSGSTLRSNAFVDFHLPRYLFLVVNEFKNGNPYSFVTLLQNSEINSSQILARIAMDYANYPFGTVLCASEDQGYIISDNRVYTGPVNLQRMNVQLVNERGVPMDLNGLDFSFCLELTYE
jgi:hypothetical protein